jgi:hypothetical protein
MKNEQQNKLLWKKKHYKYRNRHKKRGDKMSNEAKKKFEYIRKEVYLYSFIEFIEENYSFNTPSQIREALERFGNELIKRVIFECDKLNRGKNDRKKHYAKLQTKE